MGFPAFFSSYVPKRGSKDFDFWPLLTKNDQIMTSRANIVDNWKKKIYYFICFVTGNIPNKYKMRRASPMTEGKSELQETKGN